MLKVKQTAAALMIGVLIAAAPAAVMAADSDTVAAKSLTYHIMRIFEAI